MSVDPIGVPSSPELVFRISRRKAALILVLSILLTAGCVWMATERPWVGWAFAAFFALGIVAGGLMLRPDAGSLRLDREGCEMVTFGRRTKILWRDVQGFRVDSIRGAKLIAIEYRPEYRQYRAARAVAEQISGMQGAIPDRYEASPEEIVRALNEWCLRYGSAA
jgi:hypothetical protein